jgi:DNA-binding GntR family transcriptional regulator
MYRATRQERLYEMIINHLDLSRQYRRLYFYFTHLAANTVEEHRRIIEALEAGDEDAADRLIRTGLEAAAKGLLDALMRDESTSPPDPLSIWRWGK